MQTIVICIGRLEPLESLSSLVAASLGYDEWAHGRSPFAGK